MFLAYLQDERCLGWRGALWGSILACFVYMFRFDLD